VLFNSSTSHTGDFYGHGTHVAGIIGGNGYLSGGRYIGIAPKVSLVSVKVSDDNGVGKTSDTIAGLQWVLNNHSTYNIRVVNLSLNSSHNQSYNVDPLDAAVEILWFNKIVVVVAAGNAGRNALYPPANDPFVITVGADDEMGTAAFGDDTVASFSGWGKTLDGFVKPDLIAPGFNLISTIARPQASLAKAYPDHRVGKPPYHYFRMSGTSMAAPVVSGVVALLLQDEPNLTPDQVKYRLMNTTRNITSSGNSSGAGLVNAFSAINGTTTKSANTGQSASRLLWTGGHPITWGSVNWDSVNWDSVNWDSVNWDSVNWDSVNWDSDYWGP
jgi:serine protease AprX